MPYLQDQPTPIPTFAAALQAETVNEMKALAALASTEQPRPIRKAELVEYILRHTEGDKLKALWRRLDTLQQAAIAETVYSQDGYFNPGQFSAKYGKAPSWGTSDRYGYRQTPSLLGLFFFDGVMPDDLRQRFKEFVPKPEPARLTSQDDLPGEWELVSHVWNPQTRQREPRSEFIPLSPVLTERAARHDLKAVLRLIGAGKLTVSDKTYQPGAIALKAVGALLSGGDFYDDAQYDNEHQKIDSIKAFAWPLLVQAGNLAAFGGKGLELTKAGQKALSAPAKKTLTQLWQRWLKTTLLVSIWNARAAGLDTTAMIAVLQQYAKYPVPEGVAQEIEALGRRYAWRLLSVTMPAWCCGWPTPPWPSFSNATAGSLLYWTDV